MGIKIFLYKILWCLSDPEKRKPYDQFLSSLIKHKCVFENKFVEQGYVFKRCNHYGCTIVDTDDDTSELNEAENRILIYEDRLVTYKRLHREGMDIYSSVQSLERTIEMAKLNYKSMITLGLK